MLFLIFTEFCKIILNLLILQIRKTNLLTDYTSSKSEFITGITRSSNIYFLLLLKFCARFGNNKL